MRADDPRAVLARVGLAFADALDGRLDEAIEALEAAVRASPREAAAWHTLGAVRNWAWRHEAAEDAFRRALDLAPAHRDARFGIASTLLARGLYERGFAAFEASRAGVEPASAGLRALPRWAGAPLDGTLVVHGEQGLGDVDPVRALRAGPAAPRRTAGADARRLLAAAGAAAGHPRRRGCNRRRRRTRWPGKPRRPGSRPVAARAAPRPAWTRCRSRPTSPCPRSVARRGATRVAALPGRRVGLAWSVHARDDHAYVTRHKSVPPARAGAAAGPPGHVVRHAAARDRRRSGRPGRARHASRRWGSTCATSATPRRSSTRSTSS